MQDAAPGLSRVRVNAVLKVTGHEATQLNKRGGKVDTPNPHDLSRPSSLSLHRHQLRRSRQSKQRGNSIAIKG